MAVHNLWGTLHSAALSGDNTGRRVTDFENHIKDERGRVKVDCPSAAHPLTDRKLKVGPNLCRCLIGAEAMQNCNLILGRGNQRWATGPGARDAGQKALAKRNDQLETFVRTPGSCAFGEGERGFAVKIGRGADKVDEISIDLEPVVLPQVQRGSD